MSKCILIDGHSLIFRMFYGIRGMSNSKGVPTNAVYGFVNELYKIQTELRPDHFGVAFDLSDPTFRHKKYDAYKAGREKMPEDLAEQIPIVQKLLVAMNVPVITKSGYEADDIIGTLSKRGDEAGMHVDIITGDRDSFQLVSDNVNILYKSTRGGGQFTVVDPAYIDDKYGVTPREMIEVKALMGDKSDNIPGIAGIGEKTALKLIKKYHTLDNLYDHVDELKGKQKERIENGKDDAYLSRFLGEIDRDVPLDVTFDDLKMNDLFTDEAVEILKDLEFNAILKKLNAGGTAQASAGDLQTVYSKVENSKELYFLLNEIVKNPKIIVTAFEEDQDLRIAVKFAGGIRYIEDAKLAGDFISGLNDLPNADEIVISGHDLKALSHIFEHQGSTIANYGCDTYIAAYLIEPSDNRYDLASLSLKYLDRPIIGEEEFFGKGKKRVRLSDKSAGEAAGYLTTLCDVTAELTKTLSKRVEELGMKQLFEEIETPLIPILSEMESRGFKIDLEELTRLSEYFEDRIGELTDSIEEAAGQSFNINSTKQLGQVLFEDLELPVIKKTKTGYSTSVEVLEQLKPFHPIIGDILEYRTVSKLDSTYGQGLLKLVDPDTEKVYSHFNQTVTATGRLSSSDPNLQNIPVKTDLGREIRKVFVPETPERWLLDADYSQIELRVLAHLTGDENLIEAFIEKQDIHTRTASEIFDVPMDEVTRQQRGRAKAINFGLIYGKQAFSLGRELGISRNEAQDYIDRYFERYPKVSQYMKDIVATAKKDGYVTTLYGRRRNIPEINSRNRTIAQSGERIALNTPIQGTAADIMKIAMIRVDNKLKALNLNSQLILQVHDELIVDTAPDEKDQVMKILVDEMENAAELKVPLVVEANAGKSWYEAK